jgi:adenosine deaminase
VSLGVFATPSDVPVRKIFEAGVPIALGADDPLLFGSRLTRQYELAREVHGFTDADLAELARCSIRGSAAPSDVQKRLLAGVDAWLHAPTEPR